MLSSIVAYSLPVLVGLMLAAVWGVLGFLLRRALNPRIFISYRRGDTWNMANRLCVDLKDRYGETNVFLDTQDIPYGQPYPGVLAGWLSNSNVIVSLVGPKWDGEEGPEGYPRVLNEFDWVRHEVEFGIHHNRLVVCQVRKTAQDVRPQYPQYSEADLIRWHRVPQNELLTDLRAIEGISLVEDAEGYPASRAELFREIERLHQGSGGWWAIKAWWWVGVPAIILFVGLACWSENVKEAADQRRQAEIDVELNKRREEIGDVDRRLGEEIRGMKPLVILPCSVEEFAKALPKDPGQAEKRFKGRIIAWQTKFVKSLMSEDKDGKMIIELSSPVAGPQLRVYADIEAESFQGLPEEFRKTQKSILWVLGTVDECKKGRVHLAEARIFLPLSETEN